MNLDNHTGKMIRKHFANKFDHVMYCGSTGKHVQFAVTRGKYGPGLAVTILDNTINGILENVEVIAQREIA